MFDDISKAKQESFDGKITSLDVITHSHLSNCIWYNKFISFTDAYQECERKLDAMKEMLKMSDVEKKEYSKALREYGILNFEGLNLTEYVLMESISQYEKFLDIENEYNSDNRRAKKLKEIYYLALHERFNGILLEYNPHPNFEFELSELMKKHMLVSTSTGYDVMYIGKKIGTVNLFNQ